MDGRLKEMFDTGRKLLVDTKKPKPPTMKSSSSASSAPVETDPHKNFVKRTINEKPKKVELLKDIKRFIEQAEAEL